MKKKLTLDKLKVNSFVTNLNDKKEETVKGGVFFPATALCDPRISFRPDCRFSVPGDCDFTQGQVCRCR